LHFFNLLQLFLLVFRQSRLFLLFFLLSPSFLNHIENNIDILKLEAEGAEDLRQILAQIEGLDYVSVS
jgi:hypothetical protein